MKKFMEAQKHLTIEGNIIISVSMVILETE